jgi:hypothetical protein
MSEKYNFYPVETVHLGFSITLASPNANSESNKGG